MMQGCMIPVRHLPQILESVIVLALVEMVDYLSLGKRAERELPDQAVLGNAAPSYGSYPVSVLNPDAGWQNPGKIGNRLRARHGPHMPKLTPACQPLKVVYGGNFIYSDETDLVIRTPASAGQLAARGQGPRSCLHQDSGPAQARCH